MIIQSLENLSTISRKILKKIGKEDCILLFGEIGVGKTTFVRNFINLLQKKNSLKQTEVLSPTFNILYEYKIKNYNVLHYDLYRIKKKMEIDRLGIFDHEKKTVKIVEWPNLIRTQSNERLEIYLEYTKNDTSRKIKIKGFGKWKNFRIDAV